MRSRRAHARPVCLIAACFCLLGHTSVEAAVGKDQAQQSASDTLDIYQQVLQLYEEGQIAEAEHLALKALDTRRELSNLGRSELYRLLAFCAIANDDEENGVRQFVAALELNPTLSPDPITWSPKVRRAFDRAHQLYAARAEQEHRFQLAREATVCRSAALRSLYLPGAGQVMKQERLRGYIVGGLFWSAAATFVYAQAALPGAHSAYRDAETPTAAHDRWLQYRDLNRLAIVSGSLAAAVYLYAFIDALWSASPETAEGEGRQP